MPQEQLACTFSLPCMQRAPGFPAGSVVKNLPAMQKAQEMQVRSLGGEDSLEEGMATPSSILAWRIPWTEKPVHGVTKSRTRLSSHACACGDHTCLRPVAKPCCVPSPRPRELPLLVRQPERRGREPPAVHVLPELAVHLQSLRAVRGLHHSAHLGGDAAPADRLLSRPAG